VCNFGGQSFARWLAFEYQSEAFRGHVSSLDHPIFALLDQNHGDQPKGRFSRGEDADGARSPANLAIGVLDRIRRSDLAMAVQRKVEERERIR